MRDCLSQKEWGVLSTLLQQCSIASAGAVTEANIDATLIEVPVAQVESFTAVADVSDSLDGLYLQLSDSAGTVAVWFDVDDSGTAEPAHGLDRAIEVTGIVTDDTASAVATAVAAAIDGDSEFSASANGAVVTVTHTTADDVADGAAGTSTFTTFTVDTNGVAPDGSTTAGSWEVSIANVGGADGTVDGVTVPDGATVSFRGYFDEFSRQSKRIDAIPYDATGTTFLIATTP